MSEVKTKDIKLAALLLAKISEANFYVVREDQGNLMPIVVSFPEVFKKVADKAVAEFLNFEANVDLFLYNAKLNLIRDQIKGRRYD
jgi:hypothetical protein